MAPSPRYESQDGNPAPLGKPLRFEFSGKTASNRFLKGAMTERISSWDADNFEARGIPSKTLINLYRRWGEGGIGNILTGNIMIEYDHLEAEGNPIIPRGSPFDGERFDAFKAMAAQGKKEGSLMIGQVSHPGRQVQDKIQPHPISASDVQLEGDVMGMRFAKPRAATDEDIANVIEGFAHSAEYLEKAGYDGIELHAAHGYLLAQFLSPTTNHRTDAYGGTLPNRARLTLDIARAVRARTSPAFILGIKLNSVEFQAKGFDSAEAKELCALLEQDRFDFVELSGGTYESLAFVHKRESSKKREAFFMEFADLIAPALTKTKVYVTGGFKTVGAMVHALETVDGVGLARPLCQEPDFCQELLEGKVRGAIKMGVDENNFGLTSAAAGAQMRQMGKGGEPVDLSVEANVEAFMKELMGGGEKSEENGKDPKEGEDSLYGVK
ncbi:hypothetical protein LTR91_020675 [Friedmanniomyces endolithicus]|uniref:NADH:flavin oxidoreductase/NADH oxidase N-terminal domain-containing protein n=1 Tax=Friedmanniomyces endolithicus TaxID=329885 RepID=A0AAN6H979_9PEZI|nr:hypothetical protein LTR94_002955 [Friedmanniomyces endolithicus]KAK0779487.1 hypothetical protein LTR38_014429 [Friedmanniomyces endolithicus]KAK0780033.1 hypothetical protein LTR75_015178 [Friedmanniomyces endolithicus]KAK0790230.1 hypothetical protein LTR59_009330 [Friedmanniomyces endolithicus]KAK0833550.1 hypothetical protein LTR03_014649 [Friedmanniomyces endolithicus]